MLGNLEFILRSPSVQPILLSTLRVRNLIYKLSSNDLVRINQECPGILSECPAFPLVQANLLHDDWHLIGRNIMLWDRLSAATKGSLLGSPKWWHNQETGFSKTRFACNFPGAHWIHKAFWFSALYLLLEQSSYKNDSWSHAQVTKCFHTSHLWAPPRTLGGREHHLCSPATSQSSKWKCRQIKRPAWTWTWTLGSAMPRNIEWRTLKLEGGLWDDSGLVS